MRLIDAEQYRKEFLNSRDFEPMKILDFQPTVKAIPLDKVKKAKEEIANLLYRETYIEPEIVLEDVLEILDSLIAESEEQHG